MLTEALYACFASDDGHLHGLLTESSYMADINEILAKGIRFGALRMVRQKQVDEAANQLMGIGVVTREMLEGMGRDIAGDSLLFNDVDVDQLQNLLKKIKRPKVVKEETAKS